jgi:release factor glutamine methyltransferase
MVITVGEALELSDSLSSVSETPHLDVELLLAQALGKDRAYLFAHPEKFLQPLQESEFLQMIARCRQGEPIAYITGKKEFWSIEFKVSPDVLIPRPETEVLIDLALSLFPDQPLEVADLGTGSGAIAVALASERPGWNILATDISLPALLQARDNIEAIFAGKANIRLVLANWCQPFSNGCFDLIISNPPYIHPSDPVLSTIPLVYEPANALVSAIDGLTDITGIIVNARFCLRPGGWLILEHGSDQSELVCDNLASAGYTSIDSGNDLSNHNRATIAQFPAA